MSDDTQQLTLRFRKKLLAEADALIEPFEAAHPERTNVKRATILKTATAKGLKVLKEELGFLIEGKKIADAAFDRSKK